MDDLLLNAEWANSVEHTTQSVPRIESLTVKNYRALRNFELKDSKKNSSKFIPLSPLTVLLGPNGSGKSTVIDVFAFLSECFTVGLRQAWDRRNRFRELRSRGAEGPIEFTIKYRFRENIRRNPLITYFLAIDEEGSNPIVASEKLSWKDGSYGAPTNFIDFKSGKGEATSIEESEKIRRIETLASRDLLAVNALGQLDRHPPVKALRSFITGWYLSYISAESTRSAPESGPQERLSQSGDNLPKVIQFLEEQHKDRIQIILKKLTDRVPRFESFYTEHSIDGRVVLRMRDIPFKDPILAKYASDGTLKLLAYLTVLYDPSPPTFIGIEEPENHLHPRLLRELTDECRQASVKSQLMVTTHSPYFVHGLQPDELWILFRDEQGFTQAIRASNEDRINRLVKSGGLLGDLWMEGFFPAGDPLKNSGGLQQRLPI